MIAAWKDMRDTWRKLRDGQFLYFRLQPHWVGFGELPDPDQPDLFVEEVRFMWWHVAICRTCLVGRMGEIREAARRAKASVSDAIGIVEKRAGKG